MEHDLVTAPLRAAQFPRVDLIGKTEIVRGIRHGKTARAAPLSLPKSSRIIARRGACVSPTPMRNLDCLIRLCFPKVI
jgi:hypothetical protein